MARPTRSRRASRAALLLLTFAGLATLAGCPIFVRDHDDREHERHEEHHDDRR